MYSTLSPDGRWLAYQSDESGQQEIYVVPFPGVDGGKREVSDGGGVAAVWNPRGGELFYRSPEGGVMVVPMVAAGASLTVGSPELLWEKRYYFGSAGRSYGVARDGRRLLMIEDDPSSAARRGAADIVIVRNWFEELKERVPTTP